MANKISPFSPARNVVVACNSFWITAHQYVWHADPQHNIVWVRPHPPCTQGCTHTSQRLQAWSTGHSERFSQPCAQPPLAHPIVCKASIQSVGACASCGSSPAFLPRHQKCDVGRKVSCRDSNSKLRPPSNQRRVPLLPATDGNRYLSGCARDTTVPTSEEGKAVHHNRDHGIWFHSLLPATWLQLEHPQLRRALNPARLPVKQSHIEHAANRSTTEKDVSIIRSGGGALPYIHPADKPFRGIETCVFVFGCACKTNCRVEDESKSSCYLRSCCHCSRTAARK
jgi:hypothetical protein